MNGTDANEAGTPALRRTIVLPTGLSMTLGCSAATPPGSRTACETAGGSADGEDDGEDDCKDGDGVSG